MDAILPAAGLATRMRGLPKFLLPSDANYVSLIERHVEELLKHCERIWVPTRPESAPILDLLGFPSERVILVSTRTTTMSETCQQIINISSSENFMVVMPDTYFLGEKPYEYLSGIKEDLRIAAWRIRPEQFGKLGQIEISHSTGNVIASEDKNPHCSFENSWGAMAFNRKVADLIDASTPHIGYVINEVLKANLNAQARVMEGKYFDCGTPSEYLNLIVEVGS